MHAAIDLRAGRGSAPIDVVAARLEILSGSPPHLRARCPAHGSKGGTLDVREAHDGRVLLRCHAGCTFDEVLHATGLPAHALFPDRERQWQRDRERFAARRRFEQAPQFTVREALVRELDALRRRLQQENGYIRPLRSADINAIRRSVCRMFELDPAALPPVPAFAWECPPHDNDPAWPTLYERAIEESVRSRWHALHPEARAWETDPHGAGFYDTIRAGLLAREWLRSLAL